MHIRHGRTGPHLHASASLPGLAALLVFACTAAPPAGTPDPGSVTFDRATARIITNGDTVPLEVEIASTPAQHEVGLMERTVLDERAGMLFRFDEVQDPESGVWMYRTRIPLDVAFVAADGRLLAIRSLMPCRSEDPDACERYLAGVPWLMALEVNAGFFARNGIGIGATLVLEAPS